MTIYNNQVFEDMDLNSFGKAFIKLTSLDCPIVNGHISAYRIVCQQILPVVAWKSWCKQCNSIATNFLLWSVILYNSLRFVIGHHLFTLALICHCTRDHLPGKLVQVTDCYRWKTLLQNGDRLDWAEYHERKFCCKKSQYQGREG